MQQFFYTVHSFMNRRKFLSVALLLCLFLGLGFFATRIQFNEDITNLIPANTESDVTAKVLKQVNFADKIAIVVAAKDNQNPNDLTQFAETFLDTLNQECAPYIGKIQGKIDEKNIEETFNFVYDNLPVFLDEKDYEAIDNKLSNDSISKIVAQDYKSLIAPTGIVSRDFILKDPLGISFIALKKLQQLSAGDDFNLQNGFIVTKDRKNLLLFITPKLPPNETDKNTLFIEKLHAIKTALNAQYRGKVSMSYFGATPVAVANATQIKADVHNTTLFAAITLILILIFFYRNISTPILIFLPSLFGAVFALAILYFTKGTISAISLGISSILLGETTDYSIYVLTHLRNNKNIKLLYRDISKPLILCGTTTAISFLCLYFVKSEALKDLGLFASLSVISTSVFSLVLIPLLYKTKSKSIVPKANVIDKMAAYPYHKSRILSVGLLVILVASFFTYSKVTFNNNLSALNYIPAELQKAEHDLERISDISSKSIYLVSHGKSYEEGLAKNELLFHSLQAQKASHQIASFSSIGGMVLSQKQQQLKIRQWQSFWNDRKQQLRAGLVSEGSKYGFKATSFAIFYETLDKDFKPVSVSEYAKIPAFFVDEFVSAKNGFYTVSTLVKIPEAKRDAFVNAIKKQSDVVVIDRQQTNETFLGGLKENFEKLIDYSFIAIFIILLVAFRGIELVLITILPVVISWLLTLGIMGMFGLQFNIINIIVCTLVFGIGVDYCIFMTAALQKEATFGKTELPTYKASIMLSVATTILGIGVLIFAHHPALKSIALIAIIGILSAMLVGFVVQPIAFNFMLTNRVAKGKAPYEIKRFLHSALSFTYYGLGGFLISIISAIGMKIIPIPKIMKLRAFHYVFSKFSHSVLLSYPSAKRKIINKSNEKFEKPAIIIANHTSFLDILAVAMLSPKIVFLVSDWVYNSPIFGKGVRLAGFYPVSNGIDNGVEHLREKVGQGFSLMVFPEGTRSEDNTIKRFHKGAFYLAEKLNLDIVPVIIHGYSEVLPKGDFVINGGSTTVEILERIAPDDNRFGEDYAARTKKLSSFFKAQYQRIRFESEGPNYFKRLIVNSFDYKEVKVIEAVKADLNRNLETYHKFHKLISPKAKVLHFANDYGQLDALLVLQEPQRKIMSFIENEEQRAVASLNYIARKRNITYLGSFDEALQYSGDVVLISAPIDEARLNDIVSITDAIILCGTSRYTDAIVTFGFDVQIEEGNIILLRKKK